MKKDRVQKLTESGLLLPVHTIKIMRTAYNKKGDKSHQAFLHKINNELEVRRKAWNIAINFALNRILYKSSGSRKPLIVVVLCGITILHYAKQSMNRMEQR